MTGTRRYWFSDDLCNIKKIILKKGEKKVNEKKKKSKVLPGLEPASSNSKLHLPDGLFGPAACF